MRLLLHFADMPNHGKFYQAEGWAKRPSTDRFPEYDMEGRLGKQTIESIASQRIDYYFAEVRPKATRVMSGRSEARSVCQKPLFILTLFPWQVCAVVQQRTSRRRCAICSATVGRGAWSLRKDHQLSHGSFGTLRYFVTPFPPALLFGALL